MTRASKMYKDGPSIEKDKESGRPVVSKKEKESDKVQEGMDGVKMEEKSDEHAGERMEMRHKHIEEHVKLHTKHALEHMHHKGHKKELHEKHEREHKETHERHHKEMAKMHERHEKEGGEKMIEKSNEKPAE